MLSSALYFAILASLGVQAAPLLVESTPSTSWGQKLEAFHPPSDYKTFQDNKVLIPATLSDSFGPSAIETSALAIFRLVCEHVDAQDISFLSGFERENTTFAYVGQVLNGISVSNVVGNVVWKGNEVISCSSSFISPTLAGEAASSTPSISLQDATLTAEKVLDGKANNQKPHLKYVVLEDLTFALTYAIQIQNEVTGTWYLAYVNAHNGKLQSAVDFVAHNDPHSSYTVIPIDKENLLDGQEVVSDPSDPRSSPKGWHELSAGSEYPLNPTSGNNVYAYSGLWQTVPRNSSGHEFHYNYDDKQDPAYATNIYASIVNTFYVGNMFHDISYLYGFTEQAFNFQFDNFGKGGSGGDPIIATIQDPSGVNNANFATPPDGQPGRARFYKFDWTKPARDGAMENDVIIHEFMHGVTNRLTGGGTGECLQTTEARGLGEGWSDSMADWMFQKSNTTLDFVVASYLKGKPSGIRTHPYSTSCSVNPLTYGSVKNLTEVHRIGEVWANILHNVYTLLVTRHGFSSNARTNPKTMDGNVIFMHLIINALSLQPCNPTMLQARDAIIKADELRYLSENRCDLWSAFASRGLGVNAEGFKDSFDVPAGCRLKIQSCK